MSKPAWIDEFLKSSYQLFFHHDPASHLPFDAWGLHPYYNDLWLEKLYELVTKFNEKGYQVKDYLNYFPNLSSTRFLVLMTMIHYQTSKTNDPKLITSVENFLVEAIKERAKEDLFAFDKNIEMTNQEVKDLIANRPLTAASRDEAKELGKILVALASLTHGLYNDWVTDFNYEISGPYKVENGIVLIRKFPDNSPKGIWPEIDWDFNNISIITKYKGLKAKISFVGCHITYSANTINNLAGYNFQINGKEIKGLDKLVNLRNQLMPLAANRYEKFMKMSFEDQKVKYLFQENYQFKKLFELVGMDWKPSQEMIERVKDKKLLEDIFPSYKLSFEDYKILFGGNKLIEAYQKR